VSFFLSALNIFLISYSARRPPCRLMIPDWAFRGHISRALPTEMIFYLLRSISVESLVRDYPRAPNFGVLEIIIKWLQVSVS
jgi:hypothetical protein